MSDSAADGETQFFLQNVETRVGPLALVTIDNGEDWQKPNVFGRAAFASLAGLLQQLQEGDWRGLVLTGKPFVFAVGADLTEFPQMSTPELARAAAKTGHDARCATSASPRSSSASSPAGEGLSSPRVSSALRRRWS